MFADRPFPLPDDAEDPPTTEEPMFRSTLAPPAQEDGQRAGSRAGEVTVRTYDNDGTVPRETP